VAAQRGSDGGHEAQADQAEQVAAVVGVEPALSFLKGKKYLRFQGQDSQSFLIR